MFQNDTIAAISSALGVGAISIIRLSGPQSIAIISKLAKRPSFLNVPSHTIHYGHIYENEQVIDEVLISIMRAPKTFTTEDVVEINCHGGIATTNKVLELVLTAGARLAEAGEFTKRAFLSGRIDLIKAEGIMNLINAKTEASRKLSISQVSGSVSTLIKTIRNDILKLLANIEVNIDYPEYDDAIVITHDILKPKLGQLHHQLTNIVKESENGKIINEGIKTAIIGRPNVGKSSLLNALTEEEKAIVTSIEGTTRDTVEGHISLNGIALKLIDTAGIRETSDVVEKIGVAKSYSMLDTADLILVIFDNSRPVNDDDRAILEKVKDKKHLIILNKADLPSLFDEQILSQYNYIKVSILNNQGIENIKEEITKMFNLGLLEQQDFSYLSNARQIALAKQALSQMDEAVKSIDNLVPIEMVAVDLNNVWTTLGDIIGESYKDELLDELFTQFCLGK